MATQVNDIARHVERELAADMIVRALPVLPLVVVVAWLIRGRRPAPGPACSPSASSLVNLVLAAALALVGRQVSPNVLMATALGGFLVRMALVTARHLRGAGRSLGRPAALAVTVLVYPSRPAVLGDPLRVRLARLPRPQADAAKEPDG